MASTSSTSSSTSYSLSTITSSALGTTHMNNLIGGLDVDALVSAQIQAASIPITLLQNKNTLLQAQLKDYSSIKTNLYVLNSAIKDLTYTSTYTGRTATTTDDKIVTATAKNGSANGSYVINVSSLATTTNNTSAALSGFNEGTKATIQGLADLTGADRNAAFGSTTPPLEGQIHAGTFYINGQRIDVTDDDTINTVLNKISASGAGVTASVDGSGKVVLTQKTVGAEEEITLDSDSSGFLTAVGLSGAAVTAGTDPSEEQTLDKALPGVTKGYFSINGTYFSVDPATDTVDSIISKINSSSTAGAIAFYDSTTHKISITSKTAGAKDITLGTSSTDSSNFLAQVGLAQENQVKGQDAVVTVNGVSVTPTDNKVTVNGNTFTINGTGTATVTVQNNVDSVVDKVKNFIQLYNTIIDQVNNKMNEKPDSTSDDPSVGDLFCDSILRNISQSLRSFSYATVSSQPSSMQQLSQVGITTGAIGQDVSQSVTGELSLDEDKLRSALESNPDLVASLFGNSTVAVNNEKVSNGADGSTTVFNLQHGSISDPTIQVSTGSITTTYTQVTQFSTDAAKRATEYMIDYSTGKITFGAAPAAGSKITASYNYDTSSGSQAGIFVQMGTLLKSYTQVGGIIDTAIGANGSITRQISYNKDRIEEMQERVSNQQAALYTLYQNMQTQLLSLQSQSSFLTAQLAGLLSNSSSSSK